MDQQPTSRLFNKNDLEQLFWLTPAETQDIDCVLQPGDLIDDAVDQLVERLQTNQQLILSYHVS